MAYIELENICKSYVIKERSGKGAGIFKRERKVIPALENISFSVSRGELIGYIGPNGAGKSTTVKIMSGILVPEKGKCAIDGLIPWKSRISHVKKIGVVFGQRSQLWWDLPVCDTFNLLRRIYAVPKDEFKRKKSNLCEILGISEFLRIPVRQLSLGQRMRCEIAAALLHSPELLFLDEPTIGLDSVSKLSLRSFLSEINKRDGVTMVLTTHDMDDIETLCKRVMVIGKGKIMFDGALSDLRKRYAPYMCVTMRTDAAHMPNISRVISSSFEDGIITVLFDPTQIEAHELIMQLSASARVSDIRINHENTDRMIARMYTEMKL